RLERRAGDGRDQHAAGKEPLAEAGEEGRELRARLRGDQHDLAWLVEQEVGGEQHLGQRRRVLVEGLAESLEGALGALAVAALAGQRLEPQERERVDGVARGLSAVP